MAHSRKHVLEAIKYWSRRLQEAKTVGTGSKYEKAVLTKPGESPNTFNGVALGRIKSPTGSPVKTKFFTDQGSEYVIAESGECRRIKCGIHGQDEAGLHAWTDFAFFVPPSVDIIDSDFDDVVRYAFGKKNMITGNATNLAVRVSGDKAVAFLYCESDKKWRCVADTLEMMRIRMAEYDGKPIPETRQRPILSGISLEPKIGYSIVELTYDKAAPKSCIVRRYHPGHPVSYVERAAGGGKSPEAARTIGEVVELAKSAAGGSFDQAGLEITLGNMRANAGKCGEFFKKLLARHRPDEPFCKYLKIRGQFAGKVEGAEYNRAGKFVRLALA